MPLRFSIPVLMAAMSPAALAAGEAKLRMQDAATHEQLVEIYKQRIKNDPMQKMLPAKGPDPSVVNQPKDLIGDSDILCFGGMATLVPKQAVLHTPKNLAARLKFQPGSKIQSWKDFYAGNRGWITTVEVSRVQAEGKQPLLEEIADRVSKSSNLVVATYQGGPISVLPPKEAPADKPAEKSTDKPSSKSGTPANLTEKKSP